MIIDSSAIVAILKDESDAITFIDAIYYADRRYISAATVVEIAAVVDPNQDPVLNRRIDQIIREAHIEIVSVDAEQAEFARGALRDFGKRSGHPARLNYGDSFSYALARQLGLPLLFKGNDFSETDIESAI
jgi:ribonuclease VapC